MIVLWFVLGILLAFAIARYNESNKLFWQLMLAFILGYAVTVMCTRTFGNEKSNDNLTQVCYTSTQPSVVNAATFVLVEANDKTPMKVTDSKAVGKMCTPATREIKIAQGKVFGRTRDQPIEILTKPPELCLQKVSSILHET